jgi:hypothetical protein
MHEVGFVGRRHQHEARQAAEIGDVEGAGMGRPVGADQPGAIDPKRTGSFWIATSCTTWS